MSRPDGIATEYVGLTAARGEFEPLEDWLTAAEREELARLRDDRRREQWLAGRWAAKRLVQRTLGGRYIHDVEVFSRDAEGQRVRPRARVDGRPSDRRLSIAHSSRAALAAIATDDRLTVGVDLVEQGELPAAFAAAWYDESERAWIAAGRFRAVEVWAIKEAAYKALQEGEAFAPRQVVVQPFAARRYRAAYRGEPLETQAALWVESFDGHLAAFAVARRRDLPPADADVAVRGGES